MSLVGKGWGWVRWLLLVLVFGVVAVGAARASAEPASEEPRAEGASGWNFVAAPYMWVPGAKGAVPVDGTSIPVDQTVGDTFDYLGSLEAGGAMAYLAVRKGDLGGFADFQFLGTRTGQTLGPRDLGYVRVKLLEYFVEYGLFYRLFESTTVLGGGRAMWFELIAGGRWNRISTEIAFARRDQDSKSKIAFTDPLVGGRFLVPFYASSSMGSFALRFRGDFGGFGIGSDLSWSATGMLEWDTPWTLAGGEVALLAGYKAYSLRKGGVERGNDASLELRSGGPALGLAFSF